jgi:adenylate cyclase class IV/GNAT superfamily N-acetyltransferase
MWLFLFVVVILTALVYYYSYTKKIVIGSGEKPKVDKHEYEYAFLLEIEKDHQDMVAKVNKLGARHVGEFLFPVIVYKGVDADKKDDPPYIRIRRENIGTQFTVKTGKGTFKKEYQVELKSSGNAAAEMEEMLDIIGLEKRYKVEKLRDIWKFTVTSSSKKSDVEIVFDTLPGSPTYMEVEAETKEALDIATKTLGLDPKDHFDDHDFYGYYYGIPKDRDIKPGYELLFNNAKENFAGMIKKNEDLFDKTLARQQKHLVENHGYVMPEKSSKKGSGEVLLREYDPEKDAEEVQKLDIQVFNDSNIPTEDVSSFKLLNGWVVEQDDKIVGFLLHNKFISEKYGNEWVHLDVIGTSVQGEGIGGQLMEKFLDYVGDRPSLLEVEEGLPKTSRLIKWYKKNGYKIIRTGDKSDNHDATFTKMTRATPDQMVKK